MKKAAFFLLIAVTYYLAAMYQLISLMLLFWAEVFLTVCMWVLSCYMKHHLTVEFPEQCTAMEMSASYWCYYNIINSGRLPVSRCRIRLRARYLQENKDKIKYLYGASEAGTEKRRFGICVPYCGVFSLKIDRIRVYDYLSLFFGTNVLFKEMKIAILPPEQPLLIEESSHEWGSKDEGQDMITLGSGDATGEIRQIREYQAEDSYRHIHWNQTAKTDMIWIKEYEKETHSCVDFLLEIDAVQWEKTKEMDAFYRLLYSIILGLLQKEYRVKVSWYDGNKRLAEMEILEKMQCQELFLCLYQINYSNLPDITAKALLEAYSLSHEYYFKLDTELRWCLNENLVYQFSMENLEQEITKKIFTL